ncbi:MAG: response regulator [Pseudomonadota bacterium]|nr:response regulator [Pseudomonadota bacterium]
MGKSLPTCSSSPQTFEGRIVHVVDDDKDLRESLQFLLTTRQISVTLFASGLTFFDVVTDLPAAPIILDVRMPQMNGLQFLTELRERCVDWPVIALSGHGEINIAVMAIKLGALDFLEKPVAPSELEDCLERAFSLIEAQREHGDERRMAEKLLALLTSREAEVLDRLCQGRSNKQVAFDLGISPRTVEMHRANALRHLGVRSIAQVVSLRGASDTNRPQRNLPQDIASGGTPSGIIADETGQ